MLKGFAAWPVRAWSRRRRWIIFGTQVDATGRRVNRHDEYDRDADRRRELIVDADTGEVIHEYDRPLSQHRGHGSDKR